MEHSKLNNLSLSRQFKGITVHVSTERITTLIFVSLLILYATSTVGALTGYDCSNPEKHIRSISLVNTAECKSLSYNVTVKDTNIQFMTQKKGNLITIYRCKVNVTIILSTCNQENHLKSTHYLTQNQSVILSKDDCLQLFEKRKLKLQKWNLNITNIEINTNYSKKFITTGVIHEDGSCKGDVYEYNNTLLERAVESVVVSIETATKHKKYSKKNEIKLNTKQRFSLNDEFFLDTEGFINVWNKQNCDSENFIVLYEGKAKKVINSINNQIIYYISKESKTYEIVIKSSSPNICGFKVDYSLFKKYFVYETSESLPAFNNTAPYYSQIYYSLDLLAFQSNPISKLQLLINPDKSLNFFEEFMKCEESKLELENNLLKMTHTPDEFAWDLMNGPGYMAVPAGEVAHIVKCKKEQVFRNNKVNKCYKELPVNWNGELYFLSPKTHIILRFGTEIPCNVYLPAMFKLENIWYSFTPSIQSIPYGDPNLKLTNIVYKKERLDEINEYISFLIERNAVISNLVSIFLGTKVTDERISFTEMPQHQQYFEKICSYVFYVGYVLSVIYLISIIRKSILWYAYKLIVWSKKRKCYKNLD